MRGLDELRRRLAQERKEALSRYRLDDVLGDIRRGAGRRSWRRSAGASSGGWPAAAGRAGPDPGLERLAADLAARRQERLDALPDDVGERIRALGEYDFLEPEARERYQALVERLQGQVLDAAFQGMSDAIRGATPEQLAANREMVRDLDRLLNRRLAGDEPSQDDVDAFLGRHGAFFPGARTLDDIVEQLAERMAAMQSLMRSLSPEQRAELDSMMDALLRDDRLRWDLAQLASTLDQLLPGRPGRPDAVPGPGVAGPRRGARPARPHRPHGPAVGAALRAWRTPADIDDIDDDELRELLGAEAAEDVAALRDMARRLEEAGYVERDGERLELTPRGARRLGPAGARPAVRAPVAGRVRRPCAAAHRARPGSAPRHPAPGSSGDRSSSTCGRTLASALGRAGERARGRRRAGRGGRPAHRAVTRLTSWSTTARTAPTRPRCCCWT